RQFYVTFVENFSDRELKRASWLFPLYLIVINLFVVPVAIAGLLIFKDGAVSKDMYLLLLPLHAQSNIFTLIAFAGGLSAATAMVVVETLALSIMVCNDLVIPFFVHRRGGAADHSDMSDLILNVRRVTIFALVMVAYSIYGILGDASLASIGLMSFAAIAQF